MKRKGYRQPGMSASGLLGIFEGSYGDGKTRILAQEPVQNAKDAKSGGKAVHVEYQLQQRLSKNGTPFYMLTVTDTGTTGLCGKTNPSETEVKRATDEEREQLKWYHFERLFDSNKKKLQSGSRGWGKTIFLECSRIPDTQNSAMMIYDTLLENGEYRVGDMTIWDDNFGVRYPPLLNDEARTTISNPTFETPDGNISFPLHLTPLRQVGTRVTVPFLAMPAVEAICNGSLARWLQYLWWRLIAEGRLSITILNDVQKSQIEIASPEWWQGNIWSNDATTPGQAHKLYEGCYVQVLEDVDLGKKCTIKQIVILYDSKLRDTVRTESGPDYVGVQLLRSGQSIETFKDFDVDRIPIKERGGIRAFVEFDQHTELQLREKEKTQHDGFDRRGIVGRTILPGIKSIIHQFADSIGLSKVQASDNSQSNERYRRTSQFVFDRLLSRTWGDVASDAPGDKEAGETDKPWDIDILLTYPNSKSSRVNWGEQISDIRLIVKSHPYTTRHNTRCAIEWKPPGGKYQKLLSQRFFADTQYSIGYRTVTKRASDNRHEIECPKAGVYRIRAAVYEGKALVKQSPRRIHVEVDPPERKENPYAVSISVENATSPGEKRIENGDILRLQVNGSNRTYDDVSGTLILRTKKGTLLVSGEPFDMPGKPVGGDERRHNLHSLRLRIIRGEHEETTLHNGLLTLALEPGRRVLQAYLHDDLANGSSILHFESEPVQSQGGLPFELFQVSTGTPPMWELISAESKLLFSANYPTHVALLQIAEHKASGDHNPSELDINVNGLLQWAIEPLLEEEADPTRLETMRDAKPDLVNEDAWDLYMHCLSDLEAEIKRYIQKQSVSPLEFALKWRKIVAAIYPVLLSKESN